MPSRPLRTGALTAALLAIWVIATPLSVAQTTQAFERFYGRYWDTINRVQSERDLAAVEARLDLILRDYVSSGDLHLRAFTRSKAEAEASRKSARALEERIAAEKSRVAQVDPEIGALEGVIAETKGEIAEREGRQQRVVELEAKLKVMPDAGFMGAAPRERLRAELDEARRQVPNPSEIATLKTQLQRYEAELQGKRGRQPVPDAGVLRQLEAQLKAALADVESNERYARRSRDAFQGRRGVIMAAGELIGMLKDRIAFRRQELAQPTGSAPAQRVCQTNQGPFQCTGAFDATWDSVCTSSAQHRDSGRATLVFTPDGWVEARMQSNSPGGTPTTLAGRIDAAGQVTVNQSSEGRTEQWAGSFRLQKLATGGSKPTGGGTYAYGNSGVRCSGTLKLL